MLVISVIVLVVSTALYSVCRNHFVWVNWKYSQDPSLDYESSYNGELSGNSLETIRVPVPNSADNATIDTWFLIPPGASELTPLVIMSHGLGGQKDMGLLNYAEKFSQIGVATLILDYRYFGASTNADTVHSRNLINPWNHIDDILTVFRAVRGGLLGNRANSEKIILWGTSFAGGHMIKVASTPEVIESGAVRGVISQVPHLDGKAASMRAFKQRGLEGSVRGLTLGLADLAMAGLHQVGQWLGQDWNDIFPPVYIKIVGAPGETAYMVLSDLERAQWISKHPKIYLGGWRNLAPARTLTMMSMYSPMESVGNVQVPILFVAASQDSLCPIELVREAKQKAFEGYLLEVDTTHFELYQGDNFERITRRMNDFISSVARS